MRALRVRQDWRRLEVMKRPTTKTAIVFQVRDTFEGVDLATFIDFDAAVELSRACNATSNVPRFVVDRCHFVGGRVV